MLVVDPAIDARALPRRDFAHGQRDVGRWLELAAAHIHIAVGVKAFRALAEDHEIDRAGRAVGASNLVAAA